nr:integrase, catalytic region, zinc finger, CCHC-type, peptidase aspartic, catalytic [Tanacetum cinerariifolium]
MSTQQDIYAAGSESRPPMLNKENYMPWSSRLLRYAKSRPNGKLIHNSIINGPYVRRMILEPGDTNREVHVNKTFHVQTDDELTEKELKQIEADDQAIHTILVGLPEDIYAAPHQDQLSFNQNYIQQPMPNPEDITDPITAMNMALALMAKAFKLNYSTPTNNNQRISSNPRNRQIAQPGMNIGQDRQIQMVRGNASKNLNKNGNLMVARAEGNAAGQNDLNKQLSKEKSTVSFLLEEKKKLKYDFKTREDELLDKQIQLEKKIKELNNILVKMDDTTPSVARKFLNEVKSTIVTLQRVFKHRMTLETHNWSSSAHQELYKIVKDENFPIVNQVDARVQNFEIQFLKEAAKFVRDFKSVAKEADESLAKHKALELEIERLLRTVVSQDIMSVVQNASVVDTSDL